MHALEGRVRKTLALVEEPECLVEVTRDAATGAIKVYICTEQGYEPVATFDFTSPTNGRHLIQIGIRSTSYVEPTS